MSSNEIAGFVDFAAATTPDPPRLSVDGVQAAADHLGVTPAHIRTVIAVETSGHGFDKASRTTMLFEPHIFYQMLVGPTSRSHHKLDLAVAQGLAYPHWGQRPYPADSYPRLQQALSIDADRALMSCSWGLGQIMGYHYADAGYERVVDMVLAARASEDNQLAMMARFIGSIDGLAGALRACEWETFACSYNGPANVARYIARLRAAWAVQQNTPEI